MLYFKHSELANNYHVSLKTVHNWIEGAKRGKVSLQLHERGSRTYIANTPSNVATLKQLADQGKKFRNMRHHKTIRPAKELYELYSPRQILDIISNLTIHHEIPRQYNYFDGGAANWDNWLKRLEQDESENILRGTLELIQANLRTLDLLLEGYEKVNIIDLGVGNALPVKDLLNHLLKKNQLHRYIGIDISQSMLDIAEQNIRQWFDDRVQFEGHIRDISFERFDDLLVDDMLNEQTGKTINLVLLLGATPCNFRTYEDVLKVIYSSMGEQDLLVYTDKPDTETSRRYFDFNPQPGSSTLSPNHRFILDLLNIDESLYDVEMGFNTQKRMRYVRIRLKTAMTLQFEVGGGQRPVQLERGDTILLLRVWHMTATEIISTFANVGLTLLQSSMTRSREYLLTVSGVERVLDES